MGEMRIEGGSKSAEAIAAPKFQQGLKVLKKLAQENNLDIFTEKYGGGVLYVEAFAGKLEGTGGYSFSGKTIPNGDDIMKQLQDLGLTVEFEGSSTPGGEKIIQGIRIFNEPVLQQQRKDMPQVQMPKIPGEGYY